MTAQYDGPVIDSHHHFWDLAMGRHPWLAPGAGLRGLGDLAYLRHDYLPAHFEADSAGQDVAATICIEALWDASRDPLEEIDWFDRLQRRDGIAARYVARADLAEPGAQQRLERLQTHARVAGVRETVRWHPDPARRWSEHPPMERMEWQRGVALLAGRGLLLELLLFPWQAEAVVGLAQKHPDLAIVVDHCASPIDRDEAGLARWRQGLEWMCRAPNVHLKLSNFARYAADGSVAAVRAVLRPCLEAFGPDRCLWGSDYPVARHTLPYGATLQLFRRAIAELTLSEQASVLFGNAARLYRIDSPDYLTPPSVSPLTR